MTDQMLELDRDQHTEYVYLELLSLFLLSQEQLIVMLG